MALALATTVAAAGCSKPDPAPAPAPSASAADPAPSAAPSAAVIAMPAASAAPLPNRTDCPKGSAGPGTFDKPCVGKGPTRLMEATWTGKSDDKGPQLRVVNKSPLVILYGKIAVYFYDKAGKQLDVKEPDDTKTHPYKTCSGVSLFGGVMKAGEKAVLSFSCVRKESVPEGTVAMEGEVQSVGFSDASEKKSEFYWKNDDLVMDVRKKGGLK
ncbi:MAG: hypothetical protein ABIP39_15975 [Polyangiaceae bacterium]